MGENDGLVVFLKSFMDWLKWLLPILVAAGGVCIAYQGLQTWQRQLKGNFEFDKAIKVLDALVVFEDRVRSSRLLGFEVDDDYSEERLKELQNSSMKLYEVIRVMKKVWGVEFGGYVDQLFYLSSKLTSSASAYYHLRKLDNSGEIPEKLLNQYQTTREVIYGSGSDDSFGSEFDQVTTLISSFCLRKIRELGRLW